MANLQELESLILMAALGIYKELFYTAQAAVLVIKMHSSTDPDAATRTYQTQHKTAKLNAAGGIQQQQTALKKLPPQPGAFSEQVTIAAEAKLNNYLLSIRQHIKAELALDINDLDDPLSSEVIAWLRNLVLVGLVTQKAAYLAAMSQITPVTKKKGAPVPVNNQIKAVSLELDIQNLARRRRELEQRKSETDVMDTEAMAIVGKLLGDNSREQIAKQKELDKALTALRLENKPKLPVDTGYNASVENVTKNNQKAADIAAKAKEVEIGKHTDVVAIPTVVPKIIIAAPVVYKSGFAVDKEILAAGGITKTTLNFFTGNNPLAAQIDTPTQLFEGDFTDARRNEAIMPMFFESEVPAYIKLLDDFGAPVSFDIDIIEDVKVSSTITAKPPTITEPFLNGARYNQFSLSSLQESHPEKYQIVDTMAQGQVIFSFGKKPRIWAITGLLINDTYNNWLSKLREIWDNHLRITKLVEHGKYARFVIPSQRIAFNGYPLDLTLNHNAAMEMTPSFSMLIFVREYKNFTTFPFDSKSASAVLIQNLLWLDDVKQRETATVNPLKTSKPAATIPITPLKDTIKTQPDLRTQ